MTEPLRIQNSSAEQTQELGVALGRIVQPGDCLVLDGGLGAGKTQLVKGLARGLGIIEPVTSPTFNIVCDYTSGSTELLHLDLYRLDAPEQLDDIGFDELADSDAVIAIEWGGQFIERMPDERVDIDIEELPANVEMASDLPFSDDRQLDDEREITLTPHGKRAEELVSEISKLFATSR